MTNLQNLQQLKSALREDGCTYQDEETVKQLADSCSSFGAASEICGLIQSFYINERQQFNTKVTRADVPLLVDYIKVNYSKENLDPNAEDERVPLGGKPRSRPIDNEGAAFPAFTPNSAGSKTASRLKHGAERFQGHQTYHTFQPELLRKGEAKSVFADVAVDNDSMDVDQTTAEVDTSLCVHSEQHTRFMVASPDDVARSIEDRIASGATALASQIGSKPDHPVDTPCQEEVWYVGRVCRDPAALPPPDAPAHLTPQTLTLQGCMAVSRGATCRLDLTTCSPVALFPGQIVAIRGRNPTGKVIHATQALTTFYPRPRLSDISQLRNLQQRFGARALNLAVCAGPYTSSSDLEYAMLAELLAGLTRQHAPPHVVILMGPFVDERHPLLQLSTATMSVSHVFHHKVLAPIRAAAKRMATTRIILVPSIHDAHHACVFPQPPFQLSDTSAVSSIPNPGTFRINEIVVGVCSQDSILQVRQCTYIHGTPPADRAQQAASDILGQRSYYPLAPPNSLAVPLDHGRSSMLRMPHAPDILVTPSSLEPFAKVIDMPQHTPAESAQGDQAPRGEGSTHRALCVNPGRLARGDKGGRYARVVVQGMVVGGEEGEKRVVGHQVVQRATVEFVNL